MAGNVEIIEFDIEDAKIAGEIRAKLEKRGRMIGPYDTMIAAQCLRYNFVLVTTDIEDFRRVKDLRRENWAT
jgi:tRNA(fMet)-specific endonuclease VapC